MYDYIFLAKLEGADEELEGVRLAILQYKEEIPGIVELSAGFNAVEGADFNFGVFIRFVDEEAHRAYGSQPVHQAALAKYGHLVKAATSVEYEQ